MYFKNFSLLLTAVLACSRSAAQSSSIFHRSDDFERTDEDPTTTNTTTRLPHKGCQGLVRDREGAHDPLVGVNFERQHPNSRYRARNEAGATAAKCKNGKAGGYPCQNVDLLSLMTLDQLSKKLSGSGNKLNDIWGWTHSSGREFAIVGVQSGTAFVEITDPVNPIYLGGLDTVNSKSDWRDIKTHGNYAVIGSEASGHGIQIFDLTELLSVSSPKKFQVTARFTGVGNSHNVFCNEDSKFCYAVGSDQCSGGPVAIDMTNPTNPKDAGCYSGDGYSHDIQCVIYDGPDSKYAGKEICFGSNEDTITILDVSNKSQMKQLSRMTYQNSAYTHQGWLTPDHKYFVFGDEVDEIDEGHNTRTHIVDVSDLENPEYKDYHDGRTQAIDHNLYIIDDFVYQANYRAGLNVLKIKNIANKNSEFEEAGYFDLYPSSDANRFNGAWSNYPFFPSGTIIMSGIEQGLFVLRFNGRGPSPTKSPTKPSPPTVAPTPSPTKKNPCKDLTVILTTDRFPTETSWDVKNSDNQVLMRNGKLEDEETYQETECLPTGEYTFTIKDEYSDGICCTTGDGSYSLELSGQTIHTGGEFGSTETFMFSVGEQTKSPAASPTVPDSDICQKGDSSKACKKIGCIWKKKECAMCTVFSSKTRGECVKKGCIWDAKSDDKCTSCNMGEDREECNNMSCVWKDVSTIGKEICTPCNNITGKKKCRNAGCAKVGRKCLSCATITGKSACQQQNGCDWSSGKCAMKV